MSVERKLSQGMNRERWVVLFVLIAGGGAVYGTLQVAGAETAQMVAVGIVAALVVGAMLWQVGKGVGAFRASWRLTRSSPVEPDRVRPGAVATVGTVGRLAETISAPYTDEDTEAVAYRYTKRREDDDGDMSVVEREQEAVPFVVEGDHESVVVDPSDAELVFVTDERVRHMSKRESVGHLTVGNEVYVSGEAASIYDVAVDGTDQRYGIRAPETSLPRAIANMADGWLVIADGPEKTAGFSLLVYGIVKTGPALFVLIIIGFAVVQ